jgi:hypothetical protein
MSESDTCEQEIVDKAIQLTDTVKRLKFRLQRATKVIKNCRETVKSTLTLIGEINDEHTKEH